MLGLGILISDTDKVDVEVLILVNELTAAP